MAMTDRAKDYAKQYTAFMYDPANTYKCDACPANQGFTRGASYIAGPCGQQNCWVKVHVASNEGRPV